ncbi:ABC transporter permease [Petrotoga sp. 9PWA.NaAc.5.4]|uniref:ABC transporter permease n=1 Tax=Petrotoga sp. 9PWA.NaAc.5.4 TaxID=1434328 RepID=UPI000CAA6BA6|nr:ABC transporter permease [Petrotoga sp. 9PWA.NaAc.5.4]PNR94859.1 hypothetical protein X924_05430 [Petrotoga sp. 9PWA.NaAc.5.4]
MVKNKRMYSLFTIFYKETFRNWMELFFTLLLPILLLLLFGTIFGTESSQNYKYTVGISGNIDNRLIELIPYNVHIFEEKLLVSKALEEGKIDIGLFLAENNEITFIQKESEITNQSLIFLKLELQNIIKKYLSGVNEDYIKIDFIRTSTGQYEENPLDYILTGVIALSLLSGGMFSMIIVFGRYKKLGLIKKLKTSPMKPLEFTLSASSTKLILNFISLIIIIILARFAFNLRFDFNWVYLILVFVSSSIGMMGFGVLLLLLFKEPSVTSEVASLLYVAMTFFAGVYFPIEFLPISVRWISNFLPVKYVVDSVRFSAGIEQITFNNFLTINIILFTSGILLLFFSSKFFLQGER